MDSLSCLSERFSHWLSFIVLFAFLVMSPRMKLSLYIVLCAVYNCFSQQAKNLLSHPVARLIMIQHLLKYETEMFWLHCLHT